jgi:type I restriction enzyme S subunit
MSDTGEFKFNQQKIVPTGIVSPAYPVFCVNEVEDTYFYYYINESHFFKKQLSNSKQGGTRYALPFSRFSDFKIKVPDRTNQKIIGSFLSAIDRLIEKEEAAIERYESLKKGYLQRIFAD